MPLIPNALECAMTDDIILPPNSKAIPLTQGKFAIVDEDDYEKIMQYKWQWQLSTRGRFGYARRKQHVSYIGGKQKTKSIFLHKFIMKAEVGQIVDHINRNSLDNRKQNLRFCTISENARNKSKMIGAMSIYRGVYKDINRAKWKANIRLNGKLHHIGSYLKEEDAAIAYNEMAKKYFGESALLNIISG